MRGISKFVKTGNLNRYLKTAIALLVLTLVLSNIFIYAQSTLIQQELEKLQHTQSELEKAISELREENENSTAILVVIYTKTGQFPRRFNQTLFSNNKTYIYHFYWSGCGSCVYANERNFNQRLPKWTMNVSEDDFEAVQYNTRTQGQEIAKEIFSIFELPESEVTSTQRNRLMLLTNFEGFIFEFSGSILPETGKDEIINAAVMYLVQGGVALMQDSNGQNFPPLDQDDQTLSSVPFSSVLTLVVVSGLLDGINPCAFAVLLFFTAFLFMTSHTSLEETKRRLLLVGLIYILGVYLAYLTIGLGIVRTITIIPFTHLMGKIGAVLVILLGAVNIKDYFWPGRGFSLSMSTSQWKAVRKWMRNSTVLSSFIMGVIVSLFEFPCTGGIYFAILGMLAQITTFTQGFVYLLIYNVAFVLPLIVLLVFVSRRRVMEFSLEKWQQRHGKRMRLLLGLVMVALGIFLLFFGFI
jgi:cytochrome c-type biogenesis protein